MTSKPAPWAMRDMGQRWRAAAEELEAAIQESRAALAEYDKEPS